MTDFFARLTAYAILGLLSCILLATIALCLPIRLLIDWDVKRSANA